jgi:bacterioferritin-associated ferredoxin
VKKIVCRCHDVTESDIIAAIDSGYDDIESLKRITGITTGHCQGKTCLSLALGILRQRKKDTPMGSTKIRAPIDPVTLGSLTTGEETK